MSAFGGVMSALGVGAVVVLGAEVRAGDLVPPGGPVQPTMKTLEEVEPRIPINAVTTPGDGNSVFKITQAGSYYLTGDVVGFGAQHGIEVGASGVTIDLMGYSVRGIPGSLAGISTDGAILEGVTVRNGVIRDWDSHGLTIAGFGHRFEDLTAIGNGERGLAVATNSLFIHCIALSNGDDGLFGTDHCLFEGCVAQGNGGSGISGNLWCRVSGCMVRQNSQGGIDITSGSAIECSASSNTGIGISVQSEGVVAGCDSTDNTSSGIGVGQGSNVSGCVAENNGGIGFVALAGSEISGCSATRNRTHGISVGDDCLVRANTCDENGNGGSGAGIHVGGLDCRVEGNVVNDADRGLLVSFGGNFIVRNTAEGNATNYEIVSGNVVGVIVSGTVSGAIVGSTGGAGVGTSDPWANFSY